MAGLAIPAGQDFFSHSPQSLCPVYHKLSNYRKKLPLLKDWPMVLLHWLKDTLICHLRLRMRKNSFRITGRTISPSEHMDIYIHVHACIHVCVCKFVCVSVYVWKLLYTQICVKIAYSRQSDCIATSIKNDVELLWKRNSWQWRGKVRWQSSSRSKLGFSDMRELLISLCAAI